MDGRARVYIHSGRERGSAACRETDGSVLRERDASNAMHWGVWGVRIEPGERKGILICMVVRFRRDERKKELRKHNTNSNKRSFPFPFFFISLLATLCTHTIPTMQNQSKTPMAGRVR